MKSQVETKVRFERVCALVQGFESPFGLELLSTVHWVMSKEGARELNELVAHTYSWSDRKKQFSERQIAIAAEVLSKNDWVHGTA